MVVVKFNTDEEAIKLANDCPFALGNSIFTKNLDKARAMASKIITGASHAR